MRLIKIIAPLTLLACCTLICFAQAKQIEWTFPRANMKTVDLGDGQTAYDLSAGFYGVHTTYKDSPIVIVYLPSDIDEFLDGIMKRSDNPIRDRDQFITAVAVSKAVVAPQDEVSTYLGKGKLGKDDLYLYKAHNGAILGVLLPSNHKAALLLPYSDTK